MDKEQGNRWMRSDEVLILAKDRSALRSVAANINLDAAHRHKILVKNVTIDDTQIQMR